jgi:glycosyltransferase involved in cell wall biosynthesis
LLHFRFRSGEDVRQPEVSCIIPTRDRAGWVGEAIESALAQSHAATEVIVVDDGSVDSTASVLSPYSGRIQVLRTDGVGVAGARNAALRRARGMYVAFLDSDDVWRPEKLAMQVSLMRARADVGLCFTDYTRSTRSADGAWQVLDTRRYEGEVSFARLLERNFTGTLTVMLRRDILREVGVFDTSLERGSDYDLWLRIGRRWALARVAHVLADYRWHAESLTGGLRQRDLEAYCRVIERLAARDPALFEQVGADKDALIAAARQRMVDPPAKVPGR